MKIKIYSTGCPRCRVLESKLNKAHIEYEECDDIDVMRSMGITEVPVIDIGDGELMNFVDACRWINAQDDDFVCPTCKL